MNDDAGFQEFLEVHQNVGVKPVWTNDSVKTKNSGKEKKGKVVDSNDNDGGESSSSELDDENESERKDSGKHDYVCYK